VSIERFIQADIVRCDMFISSHWAVLLGFFIFVIGVMIWSVTGSKNDKPKF